MFLSTVSPSPRERRLALALGLGALVLFLVLAPFAKTKLAEVWAFIPVYQSALLVTDLLTAIMLFAQFVFLGSAALLILAAGYLFAALMAVPHALSFPRLFAPTGLIGAGPQTTAWLYMIWHAGFPLAVAAYTLAHGVRDIRRTGFAVLLTIGLVPTVVIGVGLLTTVGHSALPVIMRGDGYTPLLPIVIGAVWLANFAALWLLWKRRPHSSLDVWLLVVLLVHLFDVGLSAVLNAGRFDVGFYTGRIFGLIGASIVLAVLLIETAALYERLVRSFEAERQDRNQQLRQVESELIHVSRVTELGQMASALAHEVNQPLTAAGSYARAGRRLIAAGNLEKAGEAVEKAAEQVTRAGEVIQRLRQFVKKEESKRAPEDIRRTIEEAAALAMLGPEGRKVRLEMDFVSHAPLVMIDRVQIQQVLLNLIRNAVEAMQDSARRELFIRTSLADDGNIDVSLTDTGPGLPDAVRAKLFQPFTTTKASGMGVGLSICRAIIEAHGGRIWVIDPPGGGTAFHFTLPVSLPRA